MTAIDDLIDTMATVTENLSARLDDLAYVPRHSWPRECDGERCATHAVTPRPRHRKDVA